MSRFYIQKHFSVQTVLLQHALPQHFVPLCVSVYPLTTRARNRTHHVILDQAEQGCASSQGNSLLAAPSSRILNSRRAPSLGSLVALSSRTYPSQLLCSLRNASQHLSSHRQPAVRVPLPVSCTICFPSSVRLSNRTVSPSCQGTQHSRFLLPLCRKAFLSHNYCNCVIMHRKLRFSTSEDVSVAMSPFFSRTLLRTRPILPTYASPLALATTEEPPLPLLQINTHCIPTHLIGSACFYFTLRRKDVHDFGMWHSPKECSSKPTDTPFYI